MKHCRVEILVLLSRRPHSSTPTLEPVTRSKAFVWLERAAQERSNIMQFLKVHPFFDSLRSDPWFAQYLWRANFSP